MIIVVHAHGVRIEGQTGRTSARRITRPVVAVTALIEQGATIGIEVAIHRETECGNISFI